MRVVEKKVKLLIIFNTLTINVICPKMKKIEKNKING